VLLLTTAGALLAGAIYARGPLLDPVTSPRAFAEAASGTVGRVSWLLILVGGVLEAIGLIGLAELLARRGALRPTRALVVTLAGLLTILPLFGFMALAAPSIGSRYLAGSVDTVGVAADFLGSGTSLAVFGFAGLTYSVGSLLLGVELRCGRLASRAQVALWILHAPLLAFPFTFATEVAGALMLLAAALLLLRTHDDQSSRSVRAGSIAAARRAGIHDATMVASASAHAASENVGGSVAETP
jgi:hypothetical protein